jgi:hypothetical protein
MAIGKNKDEDDPFDGVAEDADNPDENDNAAKEKDDGPAKGLAKSRTDKSKDVDADEDEPTGKKSKVSRK